MKLAFALLYTVVISFLGLRYANHEQIDFKTKVAQLRSTNQKEREEAARAILQAKSQIQNRRDLVVEIEGIAKEFVVDRTRFGSAKSAISLLGELQAIESVPFLVENLTFKVFYKRTKRLQTIDDLYPCAGALVKIGLPSIDALFARIEGTDNETAMRVAAFVVARVLGDNAGSHIQQRIGRQSNKAVIDRLSRMQQYVRPYLPR